MGWLSFLGQQLCLGKADWIQYQAHNPHHPRRHHPRSHPIDYRGQARIAASCWVSQASTAMIQDRHFRNPKKNVDVEISCRQSVDQRIDRSEDPNPKRSCRTPLPRPYCVVAVRVEASIAIVDDLDQAIELAWLPVHSHAAYCADVVVVYPLLGTLSRPVVDLAFPMERQPGHYFDQVQTACILCTTRHDVHSAVMSGTVTVEIGIESGMPIARPWTAPKQACIEYPWESSFQVRHVQVEGDGQHPMF